MHKIFQTLNKAGISFYLDSYSTLDKYFQVKERGPVHLLIEGSLIELAKLFTDIEYPSLQYVDASIIKDNKLCLFRCTDSLKNPHHLPFSVLNFYYDPATKKYIDPYAVYYDLKQPNIKTYKNKISNWIQIVQAAKLVSRYNFHLDNLDFTDAISGKQLAVLGQRYLLTSILTSKYSDRGLNLLLNSGFIEQYWPELHSMVKVHHDKDHHPEGDLWHHVLEAMRQRKNKSLILSLAILLHDIGKTIACGTKENPFQDHTLLGARLSTLFLKRLDFPMSIINDVVFLVRNHMMPAALKKFPLYRIKKIMTSPLFPSLLELYRTDLLSTFRKPDGYYEACRVYRTFIKNRDNPYKKQKPGKQVITSK